MNDDVKAIKKELDRVKRYSTQMQRDMERVADARSLLETKCAEENTAMQKLQGQIADLTQQLADLRSEQKDAAKRYATFVEHAERRLAALEKGAP